jgi:hypothetical protein
MKTKHKFIIFYEDWTREYRAYSDTIGPENSPVEVGESPQDALERLIDTLSEMEKRSEP